MALFGADGSFKSELSKIDGFHLNGMTIFSSGYTDFACSLPEGIEVADGDVIRMATPCRQLHNLASRTRRTHHHKRIPPVAPATPVFLDNPPASIADATFTGESKVIKGWNYSFRIVPSYPDRDVVTVKSNGYALTPDANYNYTVRNVLEKPEYRGLRSECRRCEREAQHMGRHPAHSRLSSPEPTPHSERSDSLRHHRRPRLHIHAQQHETHPPRPLRVRIAANGSNQANAIPRDAFRNLWGLREVILPGSVNRLNNGCFRYCGITSIVIPAAVNTYEYNVFLGASSLSKIWVLNPKPVFVNWCVFNGTPKNRTVFCPNWGAKTAYEQDKWWNQPDVDAGVTFKSFYNDAENQPPVPSDCAFAVMENNDVRYTSDTEPGRYEKARR